MKVGPRYKVCKRLGSGVYEKCQTQKYTLSESRRSAVRPRKRGGVSDYGKQLLEKQRVRFTYGVSEKQLTRYVQEAAQKSGDRAEHLLTTLETRLDNIVFRLGFAPTRRAARQMVAHGHFLVNGIRVTIPSYSVKQGDAITVREKSTQSPFFAAIRDNSTTDKQPTWLVSNTKKLEGTVKKLPTKEFVDATFDLTTVMEFYSR